MAVALAAFSLDYMITCGRIFRLDEKLLEIHKTNGECLNGEPVAELQKIYAEITEVKMLIRDCIGKATKIQVSSLTDEVHEAILSALAYIEDRLEILEINETKVNDFIIQIQSRTTTGTLIDDVNALIDNMAQEEVTEDDPNNPRKPVNEEEEVVEEEVTEDNPNNPRKPVNEEEEVVEEEETEEKPKRSLRSLFKRNPRKPVNEEYTGEEDQ